MEKPKIGVYVCDCGINIAGTVNVARGSQVCQRTTERDRRSRVQVPVLGPGPKDDQRRHQEPRA